MERCNLAEQMLFDLQRERELDAGKTADNESTHDNVLNELSIVKKQLLVYKCFHQMRAKVFNKRFDELRQRYEKLLQTKSSSIATKTPSNPNIVKATPLRHANSRERISNLLTVSRSNTQ